MTFIIFECLNTRLQKVYEKEKLIIIGFSLVAVGSLAKKGLDLKLIPPR